MSDNTQLLRAIADSAENAKSAARSASAAAGNLVKAATAAAGAASSATTASASAAAASAAAAAAEDAAASVTTIATATPTPNKIPIADGAGKLDPGWLPTAGGGWGPVTVYTVFGGAAAGPLPCVGVRVGDRVCGGSLFDASQASFPITVFRNLLAGLGNNTFSQDIVERVVTVDDQVQQTDDEDWSNAQFFIITQAHP